MKIGREIKREKRENGMERGSIAFSKKSVVTIINILD